MSPAKTNSRAPEPVDGMDLRKYGSSFKELRANLGKKIIGQDQVVRQVLAALLSEGHCLLIGVPGLAKTLLIHSVASLLSLEFKRIQFTPDLMPSDITGATLIRDSREGERGFRFLRGPIFSNVILADEINRTPPKTQAALMEAMEERQITAAGSRMPLPRPFFVLATQNPIEQEGTYPLPVSQLDRFQQTIHIDYPTTDEEFDIVQLTTSSYDSVLEPLLDHDSISEAIELASRIHLPQTLVDYAARVVRRTRPTSPDAPDFVVEWISWGAGPRAIQSLLSGARALAFLDGRGEVTHDDIHEMARPAMRHRLLRTYHAEAEGVDVDSVIERVLESLPDGLYRRPSANPAAKRPGLLTRLIGRA